MTQSAIKYEDGGSWHKLARRCCTGMGSSRDLRDLRYGGDTDRWARIATIESSTAPRGAGSQEPPPHPGNQQRSRITDG
jgi:hypothetical protein